MQGNGGLVGDVQHLTLSHNAHVRETAAFAAKTTATLAGDGREDLGVVGDVDRLLRVDAQRTRWLWILAGAAATEGLALLVLALRWLATR